MCKIVNGGGGNLRSYLRRNRLIENKVSVSDLFSFNIYETCALELGRYGYSSRYRYSVSVLPNTTVSESVFTVISNGLSKVC